MKVFILCCLVAVAFGAENPNSNVTKVEQVEEEHVEITGDHVKLPPVNERLRSIRSASYGNSAPVQSYQNYQQAAPVNSYAQMTIPISVPAQSYQPAAVSYASAPVPAPVYTPSTPSPVVFHAPAPTSTTYTIHTYHAPPSKPVQRTQSQSQSSAYSAPVPAQANSNSYSPPISSSATPSAPFSYSAPSRPSY